MTLIRCIDHNKSPWKSDYRAIFIAEMTLKNEWLLLPIAFVATFDTSQQTFRDIAARNHAKLRSEKIFPPHED